MGLNTIHNKSNDLLQMYNVSKSEWFKCELLPNTEIKKYEMAMGLDFNQTKYMIKINGTCNLELRERVRLGNDVYEVVAINPVIDNIQQARFRNDINNFTGSVVVALE